MIKEEQIIAKILKETYCAASWGFRENFVFEIRPAQFLNFAKSDLKINTKKGTVNALSNVKRAIACQIDTLLGILGYFKKAHKENWSFPKKIEFLNQVGIISPGILKKINKQRNVLEHEYVYPSKENVEDAIDVAELFLMATEKFTEREYYSLTIQLKGRVTKVDDYLVGLSKEIEIKFDAVSLLFTIEYEIQNFGKNNPTIKNFKFQVSSNHPKFLDILKKYVEFIKVN